MKLNLGCGGKPGMPGFINVDKVQTKVTDQIVDLFQFPWPWEDGSVDEIHCIHFFEHVPAKLRVPFMEECYRILKEGGCLSIVVPSYNSQRYYQDFTHEWPPIVPNSFLYFIRDWREANELTHGEYEMKCNFEYEVGANIEDEDFKNRTAEAQKFAAEHYWNITNDIVINLYKRG